MTKKQIGKVVKKARTDQKLTYYKLAKLTDSNAHQITHIEQASKNYTIDLLLKVTEVLGVNLTIQ